MSSRPQAAARPTPIEVESRLRHLASAHHGAFRRDDAHRAGIGDKVLRRRLASGLLQEPAPGVLVHTAFPAVWLRDLAVATLAGHGSIASHRSSISIHLPGVIDDPPVEVTVPRSRRQSAPGAVVHRSGLLLPDDVVEVSGIPVTTLAVALATLGSVAPDLVEPALDAARRDGARPRWLRSVAERLHRPGQRGPRLLLDLLDELGPGTRCVARCSRSTWRRRCDRPCCRPSCASTRFGTAPGGW